MKKIAGKIIPAISTTTAFVTGAIAVELYKLTAGLKAIENYRSCFANLSMPMCCFTEPGACSTVSAGGQRWSIWDHVVVKKENAATLGDVFAFIEEKYHFTVQTMTIGATMIYMDFTGMGVGSWREWSNL